MSCAAWERDIALYVDDSLPPAGMRAVADHLSECAGCRELARGLEQDREWLSSRPPETADTDFDAMRRAIRRELVRERRIRRLAPALLMAAAAAIVLAVVTALPRRAPHRPAPVEQTVRVEAAPSVAARAPEPVRTPARVAAAHREPAAQPETGITLEEAMRMFAELEEPPSDALTGMGSDSPVEMRIATRDPNVTIVLVQETKGDVR